MLALLCQTARAHLWHLCVARRRAGAPPRSALHSNASVACAPPLLSTRLEAGQEEA